MNPIPTCFAGSLSRDPSDFVKMSTRNALISPSRMCQKYNYNSDEWNCEFWWLHLQKSYLIYWLWWITQFFLAILGLDFNEYFWNENNNICWHEKHLLQLDPLAKSYAKAFHNRSACFTCYVQALDKRVALTYEGQKLLSKTKSCEINFLLSLAASHFSVENGCVKQYLH